MQLGGNVYPVNYVPQAKEGWLSKYEDGGSMQEYQENYNDSSVSMGPGFVGMGNNTKGRNYSPAWGGQFEDGGEIPQAQNGLWNTNKTQWVDSIHNARRGDLNFVQRFFDSSAGSIQIPGKEGTSTHYMESGDKRAYPTVVQMPNGKLQYLNQNDKDAAWNYAKSTGQFIQFPNDEQAEWYANNGYKKGTNVLKGKTNTPKKAMGGSLPGSIGFSYARTKGIPSNGPYAKKTMASAQDGKEITYTHQPSANVYDENDNKLGLGEMYMLKRTVTPYTKNRDIRRFTPAPTDPRQVNFISNYAGSGVIGEPLRLKEKTEYKYPTAVPFEGDKHWNIDRFIVEPSIFSSNTMPGVTDMNQTKRNVLADMQKYYMLQGQDRNDAFRSAKKFVRKEVNPRLNSEYLKESRDRLPSVYNESITNFANENPFINLRNINNDKSLTSNPYYREYFKNPLTEKDMKNISRSYLKNFKEMSGKDSRQKIKSWIEEADENDEKIAHQMANSSELKEVTCPPGYEFDMERQDCVPVKKQLMNGGEMKFYQNGLDWTPRNISKNGSVIKDDRGQWAHPGEITEIDSPYITMEGVPYPVLGISDTGDTQMMYPGEDYEFKGKKVTEYPVKKNGGWLDKWN